MNKRKIIKTPWLIVSLTAIIIFPSIALIGPRFFLNVTKSMPIGLYMNTGKLDLKLGDIVVFKNNKKTVNFVKYVAGVSGDKYCQDFEGSLWVNGLYVASKNISKYPEPIATQSLCLLLKKGELLVSGEHPDSYDSRYFGPIKAEQVIAKVELISVFKASE